jgi:pimeloyl-ACP methyl ester carboxylesterase
MTDAVPASPLVVLVHGAWHGAWCWSALQSRLDDRGIASVAIDLPGHGVSTLPLGDLHGDAQHVADVIEALGRPVVLVGHSYGGAVITEAAVRTSSSGPGAHVRHLVYLTAFALDQDESIMGALGAMPKHDVALGAAMRMRDDGTSVLDPDLAAAALYGSCTPEVIAAALARLSPQPMATMVQPVTGAPRDTTPSTYVVCTLDRAIHPAHQQIMSTRCTEVVTLETDHSPFASMPDATADVIERVVASATGSATGSASS